MKIQSFYSRGFSLIELLVVIAIIGILVTILTASFSEARENARDRVRQSDLKALQLAIELYKAQHGNYPAAGCSRGIWSWTGQSSSFGSCTDYISGLAPEFIPALPQDPGGNGHGYIYMTDGFSFKVLSYQSVESILISSVSDEFARCPRDFGTAWCGSVPEANVYAVYSMGAESW